MENTKNTINIGLFGFGVVGEGLYHVLKNSHTVNAEVKAICVKDRAKPRSLSKNQFTYDSGDLLNNSDIDLIVELIDDAEEAYQIVTGALKKGKSVVSGNKKMIASHLEELIQLQKEHNAALLYDASACGSIPVIRNLEEYYDNDLLTSVTGILNGSSNYILSKLFNNGSNYAGALKEAQDLGFAESDPSFDVDGFDALYKLVIITAHALGSCVTPSELFNYGIPSVNKFDIDFAKEKGYKIKLVAQLIKLNSASFTAFVMPKLVDKKEYIYAVEDEYNGVIIEGQFYDKQFMFGKGAGGYPTGSAVLSDITARSHQYAYEYKKRKYFDPLQFTRDVSIRIYLRYDSLKDFSHFDFDSLEEKYTGTDCNYVIGWINLGKLYQIKTLLPQLNVFLAFLEIEER